MNADSQKRLDALRAIARDPAKLEKLLLEGFEVCRTLALHFEDMNGSPPLKRLANLTADMFGIMHAQCQAHPATTDTIPAAAIAASSSRFFDAVEKALENPELRADIVLQPGILEDRTGGRLGDIDLQMPIEAEKLTIGPIPLAREITAANAEPIPPPADDWTPPPTKAPAAKKPKPAPTSGPPMF